MSAAGSFPSLFLGSFNPVASAVPHGFRLHLAVGAIKAGFQLFCPREEQREEHKERERALRGCFHLPFDDYFYVFILSCTDQLCLALQLQALHLQRPAFQIRHDSLTSSLTAALLYIYISQALMLILRLIPLCLTAPPFTQNTDRRCETKGGRVEEELNGRSEGSGKGRKNTT